MKIVYRSLDILTAVKCSRLRFFSSSQSGLTPELLQTKFEDRCKKNFNQSLDVLVSERSVFTNMELSLKYTSVYGFDFDYTLVQYTDEVLALIYDITKQRMIEKYSYPATLKKLQYDPNFAIRGLHLDVRNGLLMKMDAYHHIQLGSVYRGRTPVSNQEVTNIYGGTHIPLNIMDDHMHRLGPQQTSSRNLIQFLDWFSIPEVALFADISEYFHANGILCDPEYLYRDVENSIKDAHVSGTIHLKIAENPDRYIEDSTSTVKYLQRLRKENKKLFILTNSPFWFVDKGMRHVTKSNDWIELFDVVVCSARKPFFYSDVNRPFRLQNPNNLSLLWERVNTLSPGSVYNQGNIKEFVKLTQWRGSQVLYIGDHVYSDLMDPNLHLGWNTVAIIPELNAEIKKGNSTEYKRGLAELLALERMLSEVQGNDLPEEITDLIEVWKKRRNELRKQLKNISSPHFGSIFRTERRPTYFSRRLMRFASLYTSSLSNFLDYSTNHTFYSRRSALPHEPDINFES